jgi:RNA polymerase sigma factor (sigma-70 family)
VKHVEEPLLKNLHTFVVFARRRVGDAHLAEDVVQESLVKALASAKKPIEEEDTFAWLYRILRRSIIDLYRRRSANKAALERMAQELDSPPDAEEERVACGCVKTLIPTLKPDYAELIRRLDLDGETPEQVGTALGMTANNLRVRHHRARQQLRERVEQTCRLCAKHGCMDCTCEEGHKQKGRATRDLPIE